MKPVKKAVIPAAGLGTRFLPVTKCLPKEMLPIVDKPVIHYVVEEAVLSGIEDIIIITGRGKRAIEDYFDAAPELEMHLGPDHRCEPIRAIEEISSRHMIHYIRQKEPRGLGDAILCAERHIGGEPFAVLLGDDIIRNGTPCTAQLMEIFQRHGSSVLSIEEVQKDRVSSYGIIKGTRCGDNLYRVEDIIEKPSPSRAPSRMGAVGRYVFTPGIFDCLHETVKGVGGELQLTDAIRILLGREEVLAWCFLGKRYDAGNRLGYLQTVIDFALEDERIREGLIAYLKGRGLG